VPQGRNGQVPECHKAKTEVCLSAARPVEVCVCATGPKRFGLVGRTGKCVLGLVAL
jgi:hypothetical protein